MRPTGKSISVSVRVVRDVRAGEAKLRGSASAVMIPSKVGVGGRICGAVWRGVVWRV